MTRVPITILTVLLLAAGAAQATAPRVTALGGAGDYLEDDANSLRWYGALGDYPGGATLDFGHFNIDHGYHDYTGRRISGPALGVSHNLGAQRGTAAVHLNTRGGDALAGSLFRADLQEVFTLMYCRQAGAAQIGLVFRQGWGDSQFHSNSPDITREGESKLREYGLGLRLDLGDNAYLDLAGELRQTREILVVDGDPGSPLSSDRDSKPGLALRSRLFLKLGERTALVPLVGFTAENRPLKATEVDYFPGIDGHLLQLGCGLNFFPDTDHFLYAAGQWDHGNTRYSYAGNVVNAPVPWAHTWDTGSLLVGWESRFQPWLTLRSSAAYRFTRAEGNPDNLLQAGDGLDQDDLTYTLGAGVHLASWDLDAALTQQEPFPFYGDWGLSSRGYRTTYLSLSVRSAF